VNRISLCGHVAGRRSRLYDCGMTQAGKALASVDAPFVDGRPSIHARIVAAIERSGAAQRSLDLTLPGAGEMGNLRFVAGGLDALFGRPDALPRQIKARSLVSAKTKAVRQPSAGALRVSTGR
jgi:hypothetical protein